MLPKEQLKIISAAWGRQEGYCFFPRISGSALDKSTRIKSYDEGPAFLWPDDRDKIEQYLHDHRDEEVYWCPSLFEKEVRRIEFAMDEHCLWADLDAVDPRGITDYPPTVAWETSPERYQALWLMASGDMQGASWPGRENQALTYHLGADSGGWDTTQLLRIPGWVNHKPEYLAKYGEYPTGKLLWRNGRRYLSDEFNDLPDVPAYEVVNEVLEEEISKIDRHEVWGRVRLKVSGRVRELVSARETAGDRSNALWEIERELADAGCSISEIVCVVRATVWNKFAGRHDELRRLSTEASKAVAQRTDKAKAAIEEEQHERPTPTNLFAMLRNLPKPTWLVKNILTEGACGFMAGQPKSFKSWCSLDLVISVATGTPFLDYFDVLNPGPVLYIQEEDPAILVKQRLDKIYPAKMIDKVIRADDGSLLWTPASKNGHDPPVDAYIGEGFVISNEGWQSWLDETLGKGGYHLCVLDPLMMIAGDVEENRAQEMTEKVFKPLKQLSRKHGTSFIVVHHMKKGDPRGAPQRGGQLMLGSVANHAWGEDSMYLKIGKGGHIYVEQESKYSPVRGFKIGRLRNKKWTPLVYQEAEEELDDETVLTAGDSDPTGGGLAGAGLDWEEIGKSKAPRRSKSRSRRSTATTPINDTLKTLGDGWHSTAVIAEKAGIKPNSAWKQLNRSPQVQKGANGKWSLK